MHGRFINAIRNLLNSNYYRINETDRTEIIERIYSILSQKRTLNRLAKANGNEKSLEIKDNNSKQIELEQHFIT